MNQINKWIGAHVSASGGVENAPLNAKAIGATGFGLFTKNQRQWRAKPLSEGSIAAFKANMADAGFTPAQVLPHDSYLINLGNPDPQKRQKSLDAFIDELNRAGQLGLTMVNMHPGSHLNQMSEAECLSTIAGEINRALEATSEVTVVLENTAGQGSNVGYRLEHLAEIISLIEDQSRIGVCIDTCHTFAAGYDIKSRDGYEHFMRELDSTVGLSYLKGIHLNDAKSQFGSRLDRHQSLGKGNLGLDVFRFVMADERTSNMPLILETIDDSLWPDEIALLKQFADG